MHIHKCSVSFAGRLIQSWPTQPKQLPCIWPYSFPPLASLMWMPALFFLPALVLSYQKIIFGCREWGRGPRGPAGDTAGSTQVGAAGWCQRFKYSRWAKLGRAKDCSSRRRGRGTRWGHRKLLLLYTCQRCVSGFVMSLIFYTVYIYFVPLWDSHKKLWLNYNC